MDHLDFCQMLQSGLHVVRRSDTSEAGVECDLVIEKTLMGSIKSQGGLTRYMGMSEHQQIVWTLIVSVNWL